MEELQGAAEWQFFFGVSDGGGRGESDFGICCPILLWRYKPNMNLDLRSYGCYAACICSYLPTFRDSLPNILRVTSQKSANLYTTAEA